MDFEAAMKLLKAFSVCRPRIYKEFSGFPEGSCQEVVEKGYVLFVDPILAKKNCFCELKDFAETNNLSITPYREALMVSGPIRKF
ncbi:MAG TPA: hypothetical protein VF350_02175 [Candidatus Bathyarchaeia archaeon]